MQSSTLQSLRSSVHEFDIQAKEVFIPRAIGVITKEAEVQVMLLLQKEMYLLELQK